MSGLKVLFMGTPAFALPSLQALINADCSIQGVVTQPDRPKGRGRQLVPSPVKELALKEGLPVFQPEKIRNEAFIDQLRVLSPDVIVVVAFGQILPSQILDIPPLGCVNVHGSLLPAYRGAAPVNWVVVNGEKESGVTTMLMDEGLDTGDMLLKKKVRIASDDTSEVLYHKLSLTGADLLIETLNGLRSDQIKAVKQDDSCASYAPILKKEDGLIDWSKDAEHIVNLTRGMLPWPTAYTLLKGKTLKIFKGEQRAEDGKAGTVLSVDKASFQVAAGKGSVLICELQLEGKKKMDTGEFLRGFGVEVGDVLGL
ncbi:MAG: methionyl-tRNA formyltransferase [Proteobacteria bacterium]|nr:methionyl-tRNA formyltransferase [Pseudomonadota bacterium]